eukprot:2751953-Pleurochrysis_carterae.AAC.1
MAAMGLERQQLTQARDGAAGGDAEGAAARGGVLATEWLTGAGGEAVPTRRRATQLATMGLAATASPGGGVPARGVAQFAAA